MLTIDPVQPGDAGEDYNCIATNACGATTSDHVRLIVFLPASGDGNGSGHTDGADIAGFVSAAVGGGPALGASCSYDMNGDGVVTLADVPLFLVLLL